MNRRSSDTRGYVNFPVDDPRYKNTGEGGMFVRLVVEEKENKGWMVCCGGLQHIQYDECLVADDVCPPPQRLPRNIDSLPPEEVDRILKETQIYPVEAHHFPLLKDGSWGSVGYLSIITLGSTGWSGWDNETDDYWHCTYGDLTEEGRSLYDSLKNLYGEDCQIYLQTWLDT